MFTTDQWLIEFVGRKRRADIELVRYERVKPALVVPLLYQFQYHRAAVGTI